jgi:hypothetical protein
MKKFARIIRSAKDFFIMVHLKSPAVLAPVISKGHAGTRKLFKAPGLSSITI